MLLAIVPWRGSITTKRFHIRGMCRSAPGAEPGGNFQSGLSARTLCKFSLPPPSPQGSGGSSRLIEPLSGPCSGPVFRAGVPGRCPGHSRVRPLARGTCRPGHCGPRHRPLARVTVSRAARSGHGVSGRSLSGPGHSGWAASKDAAGDVETRQVTDLVMSLL
jgi:hypothetical protein